MESGDVGNKPSWIEEVEENYFDINFDFLNINKVYMYIYSLLYFYSSSYFYSHIYYLNMEKKKKS